MTSSILRLALFFASFETAVRWVEGGTARPAASSPFLFMARIGIDSFPLVSMRMPYDLRQPADLLVFWSHLSVAALVFSLLTGLVFFSPRLFLRAGLKENHEKSRKGASRLPLVFIWITTAAFFWGSEPWTVKNAVLLLAIAGLAVYRMAARRQEAGRNAILQGPLLPGLALVLSLLITFSVQFREWPNLGEGTKIGLTPVILISIDSLRSDHLGSSGYSNRTTPNLDRLARESVIFETALSTTSWTLPAHVSLLTSLSPEAHGVVDDGMRMGDGIHSCAEIFSRAGYLTAGFISAPYMQAEFGFARGFALYDDYTVYHPSHRTSHQGVTSPALTRRIIDFLEAFGPRSFFLFIHCWDVHYDYAPPPPYDTLFDHGYQGAVTAEAYADNTLVHAGMASRDLNHVMALYDGEIAFTDLHLGMLMAKLRKLGLYERSLIVVTSDHGDEFFEHGEKGHKKNLHDETLRVPLMIRFPGGRRQGTQVREQVQLIDIVPTMLEFVGIGEGETRRGKRGDQPAQAFQGRNLLPLIAGEESVTEQIHFADLGGRLKCARTSRAKLIVDLEEDSARLFDLGRDAGEQQDISDEDHALAARLADALDLWLAAAGDSAVDSGPVSFDYGPGLRRQLEALGYAD